MQFIDMHAHTSGISKCCRLPGDQILHIAKEYGYNGIVLSNHFAKSYLEMSGYDAFVDRYLAEYESVKRYGETLDVTVFFAVELTMEYDQRVHILLYGADGAFLHAQKELYMFSAGELYQVCHDHGILVIQAHPYRNGTQPLPIDCVDGYEVNCHPVYDKTYSGELLSAQQKNGKILTCGCDYHGDSYRARGGVFLPEWVRTGKELVQYLKEADHIELQVQEINADTVQRYVVEPFDAE